MSNNEEQNQQENNVANNTVNNTEATKKCKYCQSDIPKKAKVCPVCKQKLKKSHVGLTILLIFVALGLMMCYGFSEATKEVAKEIDKEIEKSEKKDEKSKKLAEKKFKVGQTVKTDEMEIKFISVKDYKTNNEFMQPKKGNKYIKLEFEFKNKSDKDLHVSSANFSCTADDYAVEQEYFDDLELDATLSKGKKSKGAVFFQVPKKAKSIEVQYETDWLNDYKLTFVAK